MLQKRNTPVLRFRNLIFKDVLGVLEDWGFDHIKCFTFITQILEGHKISLKIRITGSNGLMMTQGKRNRQSCQDLKIATIYPCKCVTI